MKNSFRSERYIVVGAVIGGLTGLAFSLVVCVACTAVGGGPNFGGPEGRRPDTPLTVLAAPLSILVEIFGPFLGVTLGIFLARRYGCEPPSDDGEPPTPPIPDESNPNQHHLRGQSSPHFKGK